MTVPPGEFTFRTLLRSDAPAILAIELAAEAAEPADQHTDLEEVVENLDAPDLRLSDSVAVVDGQDVVGYGTLLLPGVSDTWVAVLWIGVLPSHRRRGIGRAVLDRLAAAAAAAHRAEHPDLPGDVRAFVPQGRDTAAALLSVSGFSTRRYFFGMRLELPGADLPAAVVPDGIAIVPWTPSLDEATRLAHNASFADHWGTVPCSPERWRHLFADAASFRPAFSRLAVRGDEVVGFVMVDEFDSETAARGHRSGYVDRVGTVRSARGAGVASALLAASLRALQEDGCAAAELEVDADSPTGAGRLYQRLGFVLQHRNEVVGREIGRLR